MTAVLAGLETFLLTFFGFSVPAYQTYKAIEQKRTELLREWAVYWAVLAFFIGLEFLFDQLLFWLPLFIEVKIVFVIYLWHPKSKGAQYIYDNILAPTLRQHEPAIDKAYVEFHTQLYDSSNRALSSVKTYLHDNATSALNSLKQLQGVPQVEDMGAEYPAEAVPVAPPGVPLPSSSPLVEPSGASKPVLSEGEAAPIPDPVTATADSFSKKTA